MFNHLPQEEQFDIEKDILETEEELCYLFWQWEECEWMN